MKKSLIAIAALAAVGAASAQSSVTLYGVADAGLQYTQTKVDGAKTNSYGSAANVLSTSRLGVKGSEALGNGLKAVFNYELGFDPIHGNFQQNGGTSGFNRRAVVGLEGNFGSVLIGRDNTPVNNLVTAVSPDAGSAVEPTNMVNVKGKLKNPITSRANGVGYYGNFSGVGIQAFASANSKSDGNTIGSTTNGKGRGYGAAVSYANGPVVVGAGVQQFKDQDTAGNAVFSNNAKVTEAAIGGSYDFTAAKVYASYAQAKGDSDKAQEANVGVTVPFGAASLVAEYGRNRYTTGGTKTNSNDFMVGANYAFSKRTDAYVRVAQLGDVTNKDDHIRTVAVGLRHKF